MLAPDIDPIAIQLGPVKVHWYGLMYLIGFLGAWWLGTVRARRPGSGWRPLEMGDLIFFGAIGVILGGRLGYVLFYNLGYYLEHPLEVFYIWTGGMSFHGGLLGVIAAMAWYGWRTRRGFFAVADFVAPLTPLGLGAGRLGNFINHELWGRASDVPWAMVFRTDERQLPRHPSQLYEFALEGVLLFIILWWFAHRPRPTGAVAGVFLLCYGTFRFLVEFVREPDPQLGYLAFGWVTMGQILSLPMMVFGIGLLWWSARSGRAKAI